MAKSAVFSDRSIGVFYEYTPVRVDERQREHDRKMHRRVVISTVFTLTCVTLLLFYFVIRNLTLFGPGYHPVDRVVSLLLLLSEIYTAVQALGYYVQVAMTWSAPQFGRTQRLATMKVPRVAIYIATYNEPGEVIEETVNAVSLLDYPAKNIYVNCDHQSAEQAAVVKEIAERHHVEFIHRVPNKGFKAGGINSFISRIGFDLPDAEYLCIFDSDSVPVPTFLREIIPYFDDDPRLALVQAPQSYGNRDESPIADAAGLQQMTFAQYISEGKSRAEAMFFCGTNAVFRLNALRDIGGLITTSITEDFATSIKLHARGWRSQYCNVNFVHGMGPTTLNAYWTQQGRWALGNLSSFFDAFPMLMTDPGFTFMQRWEYCLTGSYFFTGMNTMIAIFSPALFLLFGVRPLIISPMVYLLAFLPHVVVSTWFFFATMGQRGFQAWGLFRAQCLTFISFPIYTGAAWAAILRQKKPFAVTPKTAGDSLPLKAFTWQIITIIILGISVLLGLWHLIHGVDVVVIINMVWCIYHGCLLCMFPFFNKPCGDKPSGRAQLAQA
jgi:cellulose synthase (UDP-forming)